jgi:hypothetical protein
MIRSFIAAFLLSWFAASAWAQTEPARSIPRAGATAAKPAIKRLGRKAKPVTKPAVISDNGACDLGVIAAAGNPIALKKIGITVFGNEDAEVPSDAWGVDDLIVARVRAATGPSIAVRRIAVGEEGLFELYKKPGKGLFNNPRENLTEAVRKIAANSRCRRHIAVTRFYGNLAGTNQSLDGIGVLTQGPFGKAAVFAYVQIAVFDGPDFVIRDDPFGSFGARLSSAMSQLAKDEHIRTVEGAEFPASPEAAAKDIKLREAVRTLLTERLDRILPEYLKE